MKDTRYIIHDLEPTMLAAHERLADAFEDLMVRSGREAIWEKRDNGDLTLKFRYTKGPFKGEIVGLQFNETAPESFSAPIWPNDETATRQIMTEAGQAGISGYYISREGQLYRGNMKIAHELTEQLSQVATRPAWRRH
jgi:hypothetical protein